MAATDDPETAFLLRRAEEEAILAARSERNEAADVHFALAVQYSERALEKLSDDGGAQESPGARNETPPGT